MRCVLFVCNQNAPVRSLVMTLAHRRTRDCLRADVCRPLAAV